MSRSQDETGQTFSFALRFTAITLGISDEDLKSTGQLLSEIRKKDPDVFKLLDICFNTHYDWMEFLDDTEHQGKTGSLTLEEEKKLAVLSTKKDIARRELIKRLDGIQGPKKLGQIIP